MKIKIVERPQHSQSSVMRLIKGREVDLLDRDPGEEWEQSIVLVGFKNNLGKYEKVWIDVRDTIS